MDKKIKIWTKKEEKFLKKNYNNFKTEDLAKKLNRNYHSVKHKLNRLNLNKGFKFCKGSPPKWTKKEEKILIKLVNKSIKEISKILNKSEAQIRYAIKKFKIIRKDPKHWSEKEIDILKKNINESYSHLKKILPKRSIESIIGKRNRLKLKRKSKFYWSDEEDTYLIKNYHKKLIDELSKKLKKSHGAIHARRIRLINKNIKIKNKKKFLSNYWKQQYKLNKKLIKKHAESLSAISNPSQQQLYAIIYLRKRIGNKKVGCNDWKILGNKEVDIPIYPFKIAIEWDGEYYHYKIKGAQKKDKNKNRLLIKKGWKFIRILDNGLSKKQIEGKCRIVLAIIEKYKNSDEYKYTGGFYI